MREVPLYSEQMKLAICMNWKNQAKLKREKARRGGERGVREREMERHTETQRDHNGVWWERNCPKQTTK